MLRYFKNILLTTLKVCRLRHNGIDYAVNEKKNPASSFSSVIKNTKSISIHKNHPCYKRPIYLKFTSKYYCRLNRYSLVSSCSSICNWIGSSYCSIPFCCCCFFFESFFLESFLWVLFTIYIYYWFSQSF